MTGAHDRSEPGIRTVACLGTLALLVACAAADHSDTGMLTANVRDSAGIQIVEVPEVVLDSLPRWRLSEQPVLTLGAADGDSAHLFHMITAASVLESGEIMVANGSTMEFRIFSGEGRFQRKYGRLGNGPGEFGGQPMRASQTNGRSVSVYDVPTARITTFDLLTGEFNTRPQRLQCREDPGAELVRCGDVGALADGTMIVSLSSRVRPPLTPGTVDLEVRPGPTRRYGILDAEQVSIVDSIIGPSIFRKGYGTNEFFSGSALFQPGGQVALGGNAFVFGDPHRFEIREIAGDGTLRRIIRVLAAPTPVTAAAIGRFRTWADSIQAPAAAREYVAQLRPEGTVPFFDALLVDRAGRVWTKDYQVQSWFAPRSPQIWTIIGADGVPVARIDIGLRKTILEAGNGYLLTRETDAAGVEYVRKYGIEPVER